MKKVTTLTLQHMKQQQEKIAALTAYDSSMCAVFNQAGIDILLVGDTLGMVFQGHDNTVPVTMNSMCYHVECVARGNQHALIIGDLPFMSYTSVDQGIANATQLMQAGAHMIKLETTTPTHVELVKALSEQGIPVCSHIGLTPQSIHALGKYSVHGKEAACAAQLLELAQTLDQAGSALLVLECVPSQLAEKITANIKMPTIGIGSGSLCDGQILVSYDMLGINTRAKPYKFVRQFLNSDHPSMFEATQAYVQAVKSCDFPNQDETLA